MATQIRNADMVDLLRADFFARNEPNASWSHAVSDHMLLPALRGFWPMSANHAAVGQPISYYVDDIGCDYDLAVVNNPLLRLGERGLPPTVQFAGNNYLTYGAADLQHGILGTEANVLATQRGLSLGGWFKFTELAGVQGLISKWQSVISDERAYRLYKDATHHIVFEISDDGIVSNLVQSTGTVAINTWYHCVGRFVPSRALDVYIDAAPTTAATAMVAIHNCTEPFEIGRTDRGNYFIGEASLCWLAASMAWDSNASTRGVIPFALFEHSKRMFNV
jgi:hypothetical protein